MVEIIMVTAKSSKKESGMKVAPAKEVKFAEGLCLKKLFFIFLIGSVLGSLYEELLHFFQVLLETGQFDWSLRRGVIYGPFNVIYGFGAVMMIYLLARKSYKLWEIFLMAAILGGVIEYLISFLQEFFTHTASWDYSDQFLNIGGRTTIPYMMFWGLLGIVLVKLVYPVLSSLIERIPVDVGNTLFVVLVVFMALDMLVSWTAIIRQTLRHNHVPAFTPVGEFYDEYYSDEYLRHYFPNMSHPDQKR